LVRSLSRAMMRALVTLILPWATSQSDTSRAICSEGRYPVKKRNSS
jgi:hypothetical protein